jgi:hypothetical protein
MRHPTFKAGVAGCVLALTLAAQAADPIPIDLKPGLWEMRQTGGKVSGQVPDAMLAGVPAAQREQFKAQMLAAFAEREQKADKNCITEDDLKRGLEPDDLQKCKVLTKFMSRSEFILAESCADEHGKTTVKAIFQRVSREQITGTVNISMEIGGQTLTVEQSLSGKWIAEACGNVGKKWSPR